MASILSLIFVVLVSATTPLLISAAVQPCNSFEQQALLAIPAHLGRTPYFSSWTPTTSCCGGTWKGVECTGGRVTSLTIVDTNVTGQIPLGVFDLRFLRSLTLKHLPNLYGRLHHQFNLLTNMTYLTISHTGVSYPLTSGVLDTMDQLEYLDLSYNGLYGPVPVPALPKLNYVDLSGNYFRLSLPLGLFSQSNKAPTLKLANCQRISGPIPADFASLDFAEIDLSGNQFAGDASILFGASKQTQKINLSGNQFS